MKGDKKGDFLQYKTKSKTKYSQHYQGLFYPRFP